MKEKKLKTQQFLYRAITVDSISSQHLQQALYQAGKGNMAESVAG